MSASAATTTAAAAAAAAAAPATADGGDRLLGRSHTMRSSKEAAADLRQQQRRRPPRRRCCLPPLSFAGRGTERVYGEYAFGLRQSLLASLVGVFILLSAVFAILYFVHPMVTTIDSVSHACSCGVFIVLYVFANTKYLRGRRSVLAVSYALWASLALLGIVALPVQRLRTTVAHHFGPADGVWQCLLVIYAAYLAPAVHLYAALALGAALPAAHFVAVVTLHGGSDAAADEASSAAGASSAALSSEAAARLQRDASWRTLSANAILFLAANMMGIIVHIACDRIRRASFLSCRSYVERRAEAQEHEHMLERLLLTMLPPHLAVDVKAGLKADSDGSQVQRVHVRQHNNVSVMSATVQGLDNLKKRLAPTEFVRVLSDLTTAFEQLCEKHRCMYIRASGDSFLAACGIPVLSSDSVRCCIELAFDVIQAINLVKQAEGVSLTAFVGVHTGTIADGIVGGGSRGSRWRYECYGSDVLLARHLGITSVNGKVHISEPTLQQLLPQLPSEPGSALISGYDIQKSLISHGLNVVTYFISCKTQRPLNLVHQRLQRKLNSGDGPPSTPRPSTAPPEGESAFSRIIGRSLADDASSSHRLIVSSLPEVVLPYSKRPPSGQSTDSSSSEQVNKMLGQAIAAGAVEQETSACINFFTLNFKDKQMESAFSAEERSIALGLVALLLVLVCTSAVHFIALPRTMVLLIGFLFLFMVLSLLLIAVLAMKLKIVTCSSFYSSVTHAVLAVLLLLLLCSASVINVLTCQGCIVPMPSFFRYGVAELEADVACSPPHYIYLVALLVLFGVVNFRVSYILQLVLLLLIATAFGVVVAFTNAAGFQAYDKLPFVNREAAAAPVGSSPAASVAAEGAPATPSTTVLGLVGIIHFVLLHFLVGRHIEWVHRVDFVWKFKEWQESGSSRELHKSERLVIGNMLPTHVVPYYVQASLCGGSGSLLPANYSCDHHSVGIAVVTIPNFPNLMAEMEQVGQGASVIQAIDKIEAVLDELLRRDDCQVLERINVCGPMYIIASGVRNEGSHRTTESCVNCQGEPCGCTRRSGLGTDEDSHASALDKLLEAVLEFRARLQLVNEGAGRTLFMRAGVAVGDAVEGVVGNAYPQYNVWGPAVDDARKLEMTCKAGHIQVSKDVTLLTRHRYHFQQRGQAVLPTVTELTPHYLLGARLQPVASDGASASSSLGHAAAAPRAAAAAAAASTGSGPRHGTRGSGDASSAAASGGQPPLPPPSHFGSGSGGAPSSSSSSAAAASTVTTVAALAPARGRTHSADSSAPSTGTPTGSVIRLEKKDSLCESVGSAGGAHARRLAAAAAAAAAAASSSAGVASPSSSAATAAAAAPLPTSSLGKNRPLSPELPAVHYSKSVAPPPAASGSGGPLAALQVRDGPGIGSGRPTVYLTQSYLTGATAAAGVGASRPPPSPEASWPVGAATMSAEAADDAFDLALAMLDGVGSTSPVPPAPRGSGDDGDLVLKPTKVSSVPKVANVISTCSASRQTQISRQPSGGASCSPAACPSSSSSSSMVIAAAAGDAASISSLHGRSTAPSSALPCDDDGGGSAVVLPPLPLALPSPPLTAVQPSSSSDGTEKLTAGRFGSRAAEHSDDPQAVRHQRTDGCTPPQQPSLPSLPPPPPDVDSLASLSDMLPVESASDLKSHSVTSTSSSSASSSSSLSEGDATNRATAAAVDDSLSLQSDEPAPLPPPTGDWSPVGGFDGVSTAQPQTYTSSDRNAAALASPMYYVLEQLPPADRHFYAPFVSGGGGASYDDVIRRGPAVSHARIAPARVGGGNSSLPTSEAAPSWLPNATEHSGVRRGVAAATSASMPPPVCDRNGGGGGYGESDLSDDEQHPLMQMPWDVSEQRRAAAAAMPFSDRRARVAPAAADMCWPVANKFTSKLQRLHESRGRQNVRDLYSELESDAADCESVVSADETDFESDAASFSAAGAIGRRPLTATTGWNRTTGSDQRRLPMLDGGRRFTAGSGRSESGFASAASATRLPPDALAPGGVTGTATPLRQSCSMECLPSDSEDCATAAAYAAAAAAGGLGSQSCRPSSRQAAAAYFAQAPARRRRYCLDDRGSVVSTSSWLGSELSRSDPYLSYDESEYDNCRPSAATGLLTSDDDLLESDDRPAAISESDLYQLNIDFSRFRFADAAAATGLPDYISTLERRIRARQGQRQQHQQHVVTDV